MNRVYLVRHAESVANTRGIYQGRTYDTGLSLLGYRQAAALAGQLKSAVLDRIITSPLKRSAYTAHLTSVYHSVPVEAESRLTETDHGLWEGVSKAEIAVRWPDIYTAWQTAPAAVIFPGGESFSDTGNRVLAWWEEISQTSGNILVVTHDNIIRIILAHLQHVSLDRIWEFDLHPASVTVIENNQIKIQNDTTHLNRLQSDLSIHAL